MAEIKREFSWRSELLLKDTYQVLVNPGMDLAFITILVNIIEELVIEPSEAAKDDS